jgi:hypothetical protein
VRVDEPGQHPPALGIDDLRPARRLGLGTDRADPPVGDDDGAVVRLFLDRDDVGVGDRERVAIGSH